MSKKILFTALAAYLAVSGYFIYNTYKKPANKDMIVAEDTIEEELAQSETSRIEETTKEFAETPPAVVVEEPKPSLLPSLPSIFKKKEEPAPVIEEKPKTFAKKTKEIFLGPDPEPKAASKPASQKAKRIVEKEREEEKEEYSPPKKSWFSKPEPERKSPPKPLVVKKAEPKSTDHRDMNVFRQHGKDGEYRGGSNGDGVSYKSSGSSSTSQSFSSTDHRNMKIFSHQESGR